jgi:26S proteasome subunit RPN7
MIDVEVLDAMFARATHYARIGDKELAYAAYEAIQARVKISTGRRIDAAMAHIRVCLLPSDSISVACNCIILAKCFSFASAASVYLMRAYYRCGTSNSACIHFSTNIRQCIAP